MTKGSNKQNYKVVLFSPDRHVTYDGATPDERGIGGGITARVRLLRALAALGHEVTAYVNCEHPGIYDGVRYLHFSTAESIDADVFITITTGGDLDLRPVCSIPVQARLKIVWIHGVAKPKHLEDIDADFIYVSSNFLRNIAVSSWGITPDKLFVSYNGLEQNYFVSPDIQLGGRNPYGLVYVGHPSKGLQAAISVFEELRLADERFQLDIFGGAEIWGQVPQSITFPPGVNFRGLVGQRLLARELFKYNFGLFLQSIPEEFGIAVQECKRAGVIVIASDVGAFPELIKHGYDGFLVKGDPNSSETRDKVVKLIFELLSQPEYMEFVRNNAQSISWDWNLVARTWVNHWDLVLNGINPLEIPDADGPRYCCPSCQTTVVRFPDGYRCLKCAYYYPIINGIPSFSLEAGAYSEIFEPDFRALVARVYKSSWRQAVTTTLGEKSEFLVNYILDESRGYFHYLFELSPEAVVLDLGAGFGTISCAIGRHCRVVALDNHLMRLAFLAERCRQEKLSNVIVVHGDALQLPFDSEQFDLITVIGVLEWAGTWRDEGEPEQWQLRLLQETYRVLKPGGYLIIGIENRYGAKYLLGEPDDHTGIRNITYLPREEADLLSIATRGVSYRVRTHSRADYEEILRAVGFRVVSFYAPYPDYRTWSALIPLDDSNILRFYLESVEPERNPALDLQRIAARLGVGRDFVDSFFIVGGK